MPARLWLSPRRHLLLLLVLATVGLANPSTQLSLGSTGSVSGVTAQRATTTVPAATSRSSNAAVHRATHPLQHQVLTAGQHSSQSSPTPQADGDRSTPLLAVPMVLGQLPRPPSETRTSTLPDAPTGRSPPFSAGT